MSKARGLVLIAAGLGVAAYLLPGESETDTQILPSAPVRQASEVPKTAPAASPKAPAGTSIAAIRGGSGVEDRAPVVKPQAAYKPASAPPTAAMVGPNPPRAVVVTVPGRDGHTATRPVFGAAQPVAAPPDRAQLARELQKELRRVGCYWGEINGAWTSSTRQAMKAFTDRVNATLPVDQPDYILLAMVQNHADKACGKPCPAGQGLADDGRCLPNAIIAKRPGPSRAAAHAHEGARTHEAPTSVISGWTTTATAARDSAKAAQPRETPPPVISGWTTTATVAAPSLPGPPIEGRMALAGPGQPKAVPPLEDGARPAATGPTMEPPGGPAAEQPGARPRPSRPPSAQYDRRPRYTQAPQNWTRTVFKRLESNQP